MGCQGVLEPEQVEELREIFSRFDMNSDGSLTHLELAALLRSLGLKPTGDQIHSLLKSIDSNSNGSVEFEELLQVIAPQMTMPTHPSLDHSQLCDLFRAFDRDGNGYITAAELARSMANLGHPLTFRELTEMFKEADSDGDGVISFPEFAAIMAKSATGIWGC
ncbi:hypothetical protein AMTRI_Chr01g135250 [Amborella trichopoda]|uniref:EF-hand domain-containing protein n=1 Tax=Amborella trichopoda TaxID=13333 RepID=W1PHM4_AMBTC|nr:probable calcium-binding protein CML14 [Amborella trichopoda]ERN06615.1 hypothetical protein AMTR_s00058p00162560 [Amborella trichopoda]|eukprot:XP_011623618.1 probable calcium-binding protein CML14 [Amborella trichopoda]